MGALFAGNPQKSQRDQHLSRALMQVEGLDWIRTSAFLTETRLFGRRPAAKGLAD